MCLIQETKLVEKDSTPPFPGHNSTSHREGGLLTRVKEGIPFQSTAEGYSPPLKGLTIQIQLFHQRWATIHNLCVVSVKGNALPNALALNNTCVGPLTPGVGDINAYSPPWGECQLVDQRGETFAAWLISRNSHALSEPLES